jgi:hypothetical protein
MIGNRLTETRSTGTTADRQIDPSDRIAVSRTANPVAAGGDLDGY